MIEFLRTEAAHTKVTDQIGESVHRKCFGENVGQLVISLDKVQLSHTLFYVLLDEMQADRDTYSDSAVDNDVQSVSLRTSSRVFGQEIVLHQNIVTRRYISTDFVVSDERGNVMHCMAKCNLPPPTFQANSQTRASNYCRDSRCYYGGYAYCNGVTPSTTEDYGDAIVIPAILAENFELKVGLLTLTTNLKNDITNFQQRFDETFSDAWNRFKDLLRKCPHHGFLELHQIDAFYNALTQSDQDSLNAAAGGNLLNRTPRDALTIIENKSKVHTSRNKPVVSKTSATTSSFTPAYLPEITARTDAVKAMLLQNKTPSPAPVKAIEEICVTCGGPHPYYECLATDDNNFNAFAATGTYNQGGHGYRPLLVKN
nr:reverse transcriptase domain-containing protein [Tanacetum cinerariifolium]